MYTKKDILDHFDPHLALTERHYFPAAAPHARAWHFWLDLEHGYQVTAGCRIHLYADEDRWAVVAEMRSYANRGFRAELNLYYFGNCIDYPLIEYPDHWSISNWHSITLIDGEELERLSKFDDEEKFETINPAAGTVLVRDQRVLIEPDPAKYRSLGIHYRNWAPHTDPEIHFSDLLRYLDATQPGLVQATEPDIREHIPPDLRKLMTIDAFHYTTVYQENHNPSEEELYQLIAQVLITRNPAEWRPTLPANNHWSNWESGYL